MATNKKQLLVASSSTSKVAYPSKGKYGQMNNQMKESSKYEKRMPMATLADEIFGFGDNLYEEDKDDCYDSYYDCDYLTDEVNVQLELPLEDPREVISNYKKATAKYERAHEKMASYALKWHYLLEDIEGDEVLTKMFKDMTLLRKLSGGTIL